MILSFFIKHLRNKHKANARSKLNTFDQSLHLKLICPQIQIYCAKTKHTTLRIMMKKTFNLTHPKIKYDRLIEKTKSDIRKYIKRERRKELPDNVDYWDFDCKYGDTEAQAQTVHLAKITKCIDKAATAKLDSFYIEILAKNGHRIKTANPKKDIRDTEGSEDIA